MIPASRPDRLRLAKLGGAVLAVLAFAAWRVAGSMADAPAAGSHRVVAIGGERPPVAALASVTRSAEPALSARGADSGALIDPDPFRPLESAAAPSATKPTPTPTPAPLAGAIVPDAAATPLKVSPAGAPKAAPAIRLTGVVVGARPTAVVRFGDDEIVVRPGARLPDGSRLVRIDAASVTLSRAGRSSVLWVAD